MAQRGFRILVVLLLIFPLRIFSQQQLPPVGKNTSHTLKISREIRNQLAESWLGYRRNELNITIPFIYEFEEDGNFGGPIFRFKGPPQSSAFFCKKELQFENATSIPLRFRLGSLEYVNRLEGKEKWIGAGSH